MDEDTLRFDLDQFFQLQVEPDSFFDSPNSDKLSQNCDQECDQIFTDATTQHDEPTLFDDVKVLDHLKKPPHSEHVKRFLERVLQHTYSISDRQQQNTPSWGLQWLVLQIYGKRWFSKNSLTQEQLNEQEVLCLKQIQQKLSYPPERRERIYNLIHNKQISKRLIHYFIAHYLLENNVRYWVDRTTYPPRIVGNINDSESSPAVKQALAEGRQLEYIQLCYAYKNLKSPIRGMCMNAPYQRSKLVRDQSGKVFSLCQLYFFEWYDDIGASEAFKMLESDIRRQKEIHDTNEHARREAVKLMPKRIKKSKATLDYRAPCVLTTEPLVDWGLSHYGTASTMQTWMKNVRSCDYLRKPSSSSSSSSSHINSHSKTESSAGSDYFAQDPNDDADFEMLQ